MQSKIRKQRAVVETYEAAVRHYRAEMDAGRAAAYGDLSALLNTAMDAACAESRKLNALISHSNQ